MVFSFFLIGCTGYHNNTFASWLILCIMSNDLLKRITECLLMQFGDFPAHRDSTLRAKYFGHLRQRLYQSERRLIENHRPGLDSQFGQTGGTTFLLRKESFKGETVAR